MIEKLTIKFREVFYGRWVTAIAGLRTPAALPAIRAAAYNLWTRPQPPSRETDRG